MVSEADLRGGAAARGRRAAGSPALKREEEVRAYLGGPRALRSCFIRSRQLCSRSTHADFLSSGSWTPLIFTLHCCFEIRTTQLTYYMKTFSFLFLQNKTTNELETLQDNKTLLALVQNRPLVPVRNGL